MQIQKHRLEELIKTYLVFHNRKQLEKQTRVSDKTLERIVQGIDVKPSTRTLIYEGVVKEVDIMSKALEICGKK